MQRLQKTFYLGPSIILFTEDIKMWMIHIDILEIFVILQLKQHQGDIFEQDIELCPFCYFLVTNAGKDKEAFFVNSLGFTFYCLLFFFAET
jgi:hypothetical protein